LARLELRGVSKTFPGEIEAARAVDLTVEDGELFVIVGPSGSGKSTLLRLVAGLEALDSGSIHLDDRRIDGLPPAGRDLAMVFQDQLLYPHLNVLENLGFGLRARKVARAEVETRVRETAATLGLADCLDRSPATLSGGQRRRVALGRALVLRPKLFLFDEPFSGLDAPLRASTRAELADLNRQAGATMVLVTHDQGEALALGDRLAVIDRGRVVQVGRPMDLYDRPANRFVARFLGQPAMNLLPCLVAGSAESVTVQLEGMEQVGALTLPRELVPERVANEPGSTRWELGFRPEHVAIVGPGPGLGTNQSPSFAATIRRLEPLGHETLAFLDLGPHAVAARLPPRGTDRVGDRVELRLNLGPASWFDSASGTRIERSTLADPSGRVP
jgi:multiple sugar transport system ATP-binding protein